MIYNFIEDKKDLKTRILELNNTNQEDLNIDKYNDIKYDDKIIEFKNKILELKDLNFLIVGDGDCDGICATTIMKRLLDYLNINNNYYIPSRTLEGFGINEDIVMLANKHHYDIILALDNGIGAYDINELCLKYDIKYLVIDHHEYDKEPTFEAFIHPNYLSKDFNNLSAGGLCALLASSIYEDDYNIVLGGLATYADMVGVLRYNRYLIKKMLEILNNKDIYQINILSNSNSYTYKSISFDIIPKINTFLRLGLNVNLVVKYLLGDKEYCLKQIDSINKYNKERKDLTQKMSNDVISMINEEDNIILLKDDNFKEGLCGLIANKLLNNYKKPTIILTKNEELIKGSARSLKDFDIFNYLKDFTYYETFGGHPQALGLSFKIEYYDEFIEYINNHEIFKQEYIEDILVLNQEDYNITSYYIYEELKPYGIDFKEPKFSLKEPIITEKRIMADKYPKYIIEDKISAISFNSEHLNKPFTNLIGHLDIDKFAPSKLLFVIEELL